MIRTTTYGRRWTSVLRRVGLLFAVVALVVPVASVRAAAADHLQVQITGSVTAGDAVTVTVTALDSTESPDTGYVGEVHFTSNDGQAVLPSNYTFDGGDSGVHTFPVTFKTAGNRSVTATDTGDSSIGGSDSAVVNPGDATDLIVAGFTSPATSGVADTFTVTAKDAFNNIATGYTGTVHFTSSDGAALLPGNYTFTGGNNGVHSFSATLTTAGTKSITATDTVTASINGSQTGIVVNGGALDHFVVAGFTSPATAGVADSFSVTARDVSNNVLTGYTGTVHFTSNDGQAVLPSNYTFVGGDNGVHTFSATLKTVGSHSITATDGGVSDSQTGIVVNPASAASLTITTSFPDPTAAGDANIITVTLTDAFDNIATGYRGTVHVASSDGAAALPPNRTFTAGDAGTHDFSITLNTPGERTITVTDIANGALQDIQTAITVTAGSAATLVVSGYPDPIGLNTNGSVTVTAQDGSGNTAIGYLGTVHLTANGGVPSLASDYKFKSSDNGVHVFTGNSFGAPGTWTLTATDTVTSTITGFQSGINVTNQAPTCSAMSKTTGEDAAFSDSLGGFCSDPDSGPSALTFGSPSNPPHGTVTAFVASTGAFTYTPDLGYVGADSFTSSASDGNLSTPITFSITVSPINDAPVFVPGANQQPFEDSGPQQANAWATGIGPGGGLDEAGQTLNFLVTNNHTSYFSAQPTIDAGTGNLTYTLAANATGDITVTVRLHDNGGTAVGGVDTSAPVTFHIVITPVNDPPVFTGSNQTVAEQSTAAKITLSGWAHGLSVGPNETGQSLIGFTTTVDLPGLFSVKPAVDPTGTLTYTPAPHRNGVATLTVTLQDNGGVLDGGFDTSTQTFTLTVTGVDDPPIAVNDLVTVVAGSPAMTIPILDNDNANNPDQGEVLTVRSATRPSHGTITILPGGAGLRYRPAAGYHGSDTFDYTISDPAAHTDSAHVVVAIPRDTFKPTVIAPIQSIVNLQTIGSRTVSVRISWTGADRGAGIARYELYRSRNGGAWVRVHLGSAKSRSTIQILSINTSYRFKVRAVDKVGNVGVFVGGPTFRVARAQETPNAALAYAGTWGLASGLNYSSGHARASVTALDSATYTFTGRNVAWVAERSLSRGSATVLIDGVLAGTVNLQSTKLTFRRVVFSKSFGALGPHTIQIVVAGTAGHPRVDIDAFMILR